ncbi:MAG: hypothetical protein M9894_10055 [Planctomycetes bacterium]|nr:hypothetical protein [Planctomycetota bacterium]
MTHATLAGLRDALAADGLARWLDAVADEAGETARAAMARALAHDRGLLEQYPDSLESVALARSGGVEALAGLHAAWTAEALAGGRPWVRCLQPLPLPEGLLATLGGGPALDLTGLQRDDETVTLEPIRFHPSVEPPERRRPERLVWRWREASRRRAVQVACSLAALAFASQPAAALEYRDAAAGCSLRVPDDWSQLSEAELAAFAATLPRAEAKGAARLRHLAAFRPTTSDAYPILLVSELAVGRASLHALARSMERLRGSEELREALEAAEVVDVEFGRPVIDERRLLVLVESRAPAERADEHDLVTVCAMFPGRASVIQLTVYCAEDAPRTRRTFEAMLDTFRFDADRGYLHGRGDASDGGLLFFLMLCALGGFLYRVSTRGSRPGEVNPERRRPRRGGPPSDPTGFVPPVG